MFIIITFEPVASAGGSLFIKLIITLVKSMAKKTKKIYMCTECGNEYLAWQGRCDYCGSWNTISEQRISSQTENKALGITGTKRKTIKPLRLNEVGTDQYQRISSGIEELDRVLGGGIVLGSLILISGEPGIGKSTLILESANNIAKIRGLSLYASGEESEEQVKLRADRVCENISDELMIIPEVNLNTIISICDEISPNLLIVDSIQTMFLEEIDSAPGSVSQIRACTSTLMHYAKENNIPIFIVAHVTKSGELAGPKTIEHMVDCVLRFEGERDRDLRILRSWKNRFGTTDEIGAFRMCKTGMEEVKDLSGQLLENAGIKETGSVVSAIYEGSRPVFFEIQALVTPANVGFARRTSVGIDINRLNMILAVLEKKAGIKLMNHDVYVNVVGGVKPGNPGTDLAVALAIYSSYYDKISKRKIVAIGEVGLTGNLRGVKNIDKIIMEAARIGYEAIILPKGNKKSENKRSEKNSEILIYESKNILDAIKMF